MLVSSDALARGIDVEGVQVVINYDAPVYAKTYVHRCGRAGEPSWLVGFTCCIDYRSPFCYVLSASLSLTLRLHGRVRLSLSLAVCSSSAKHRACDASPFSLLAICPSACAASDTPPAALPRAPFATGGPRHLPSAELSLVPSIPSVFSVFRLLVWVP